MKLYIGFDDTDHHEAPYGTGKLARWFADVLPESCRCTGVVRQQFLVSDAIPYTSHNSGACLVAEVPDEGAVATVVDLAVGHLGRHALEGSDPGLCVAAVPNGPLENLMAFGMRCTRSVVTQREAMDAARSVHLSGHGGTCDGIIGAAAAVGLTMSGWAGRYIECGNLRGIPESVTIQRLLSMGIQVVSTDRDAALPAPDDEVATNRWVRPRLLGHRPVLLVRPKDRGRWENIDRKRHGSKGKPDATVSGSNPFGHGP